MTILIVDDNAVIWRVIRRTISHLANEIYECEDGADALTAYSEHQPDLVLMDVRMPRTDGLAATRQIMHLHPTARVVIVTNYDAEDLKATAFAAGAIGYVLKDDLAELEAIVAGADLK